MTYCSVGLEAERALTEAVEDCRKAAGPGPQFPRDGGVRGLTYWTP